MLSKNRMLDFEGETVTGDDKVQGVIMNIGIWSGVEEITGDEGFRTRKGQNVGLLISVSPSRH